MKKNLVVDIRKKQIPFSVERLDSRHVKISCEGRHAVVEFNRMASHHYTVLISNTLHAMRFHQQGPNWQAFLAGETVRFTLRDAKLLRRELVSSYLDNKSGKIIAPMPGKIINVKVKLGQKVCVGEGVVVVEAMKMENEFKSAIDGIVKTVWVKKGDVVENGAVLVEVA